MLYALLSRRRSHARIRATDLPSALPLIEHNAAALKKSVETSSDREPESTVAFFSGVLDWDEPILPPEVEADPPDVLIMADVTYNTAAFPSLVATLRRLNSPLLVMGYKERDPAERELWRLFKSENLQLTRVDDVTGAGGAPVEIWIGWRGGVEE